MSPLNGYFHILTYYLCQNDEIVGEYFEGFTWKSLLYTKVVVIIQYCDNICGMNKFFLASIHTLLVELNPVD
jgi:hypothetical protein